MYFKYINKYIFSQENEGLNCAKIIHFKQNIKI